MQHTIWPQHVLLFTTSTSGQVTGACDHRQKGRESECSQFRKKKSGDCDTAPWNFLGQTNLGQCLLLFEKHLVCQSHLQSITLYTWLCECLALAQPERLLSDKLKKETSFKSDQLWTVYINSNSRWCHSVADKSVEPLPEHVCVSLYPVWLTSGQIWGTACSSFPFLGQSSRDTLSASPLCCFTVRLLVRITCAKLNWHVQCHASSFFLLWCLFSSLKTLLALVC